MSNMSLLQVIYLDNHSTPEEILMAISKIIPSCDWHLFT